MRAKTARAAAAFVIGTLQVGRLPVHAPLQRANRQPLAGVAASRTPLNEVKDAAQRDRQASPRGVERTSPLPATLTESLNLAVANSAVTEAGAVRAATHSPAPRHAPPQRTSRIPLAGTASSTTFVPRSHSTEHVAVQSGPGWKETTLPAPRTATVSTTWSPTCLSQEESCTSNQLPECA